MALDTIYSRPFAFSFLLLIASCRGWGKLPSDSEEISLSTHEGQQSVNLATALCSRCVGLNKAHSTMLWNTGRVWVYSADEVLSLATNRGLASLGHDRQPPAP